VLVAPFAARGGRRQATASKTEVPLVRVLEPRTGLQGCRRGPACHRPAVVRI